MCRCLPSAPLYCLLALHSHPFVPSSMPLHASDPSLQCHCGGQRPIQGLVCWVPDPHLRVCCRNRGVHFWFEAVQARFTCRQSAVGEQRAPLVLETLPVQRHCSLAARWPCCWEPLTQYSRFIFKLNLVVCKHMPAGGCRRPAHPSLAWPRSSAVRLHIARRRFQRMLRSCTRLRDT